jgi:hypothetical protein
MDRRARRRALILDVGIPRQRLGGRTGLNDRSAAPEEGLESQKDDSERARHTAPRPP